ncbi:MAG: YecA family protein, partial [Pseudomonadales bacterium]|nr:YecA family protein [Pseudomonadales bacterium]
MDFDPDQFLDYYEFGAELKKIDAVASAAEAHGILVGQLGGGLKLDGLMWLKQFLLGIGVKREPKEDQRQWFYQFHELTGNALADPELSFQLLLPDDDDPLEDRLEAVGDWCSGFLAGFGSAGHSDTDSLPEDIAAALKDMVEISKVDVEIEGEIGFEEENAYLQLVEYLKTVALSVRVSMARRTTTGLCDGTTLRDTAYDGVWALRKGTLVA